MVIKMVVTKKQEKKKLTEKIYLIELKGKSTNIQGMLETTGDIIRGATAFINDRKTNEQVTYEEGENCIFVKTQLLDTKTNLTDTLEKKLKNNVTLKRRKVSAGVKKITKKQYQEQKPKDKNDKKKSNGKETEEINIYKAQIDVLKSESQEYINQIDGLKEEMKTLKQDKAKIDESNEELIKENIELEDVIKELKKRDKDFIEKLKQGQLIDYFVELLEEVEKIYKNKAHEEAKKIIQFYKDEFEVEDPKDLEDEEFRESLESALRIHEEYQKDTAKSEKKVVESGETYDTIINTACEATRWLMESENEELKAIARKGMIQFMSIFQQYLGGKEETSEQELSHEELFRKAIEEGHGKADEITDYIKQQDPKFNKWKLYRLAKEMEDITTQGKTRGARYVLIKTDNTSQ